MTYPAGRSIRLSARRILAVLAFLAVAGCSGLPASDRASQVLTRNDDLLIALPGPGADSCSLAAEFLGTAERAWMIEDANPGTRIRSGQTVVIPLRDWNRYGVTDQGFQTVPILAYHRVGNQPSAMTITPGMLRRQFRYLKDKGYRVIPLSDLTGFLEGRQQLPQRALVLSFDDGHPSFHDLAFPILQEFGYPATLFVYSDYIGRGGITREQLKEIQASGLVTVQPHSKTHGNLAVRLPGEDDAAYHRRLERESRTPRDTLSELVPGPKFAFAYPFGDTNPELIAVLRRDGYSLGATVQPGANAAFAPHWLLRRSMIFGDRDMDAFVERLNVFRSL
jgi:peptidoglycan/xylan/chitin deacetylase (PgdA/CDA1 family)